MFVKTDINFTVSKTCFKAKRKQNIQIMFIYPYTKLIVLLYDWIFCTNCDKLFNFFYTSFFCDFLNYKHNHEYDDGDNDDDPMVVMMMTP